MDAQQIGQLACDFLKIGGSIVVLLVFIRFFRGDGPLITVQKIPRLDD